MDNTKLQHLSLEEILSKAVILDIETTGLGNDDTLLMVGTRRVRDGREQHREFKNRYQIQEFLRDHEETIWVIHNACFDVAFLERLGIKLERPYIDTMLLSYINYPGRPKHSLDYWGQQLGLEKIDYRQALIDAGLLDPDSKKGAEYKVPFNSVMVEYCLRDCAVTQKILESQLPKLYEDPKAWKLYFEIDLPFQQSLMEMERTGWAFDETKAQSLIGELEHEIHSTLSKLSVCVPPLPGKEVIYKRGSYKRGDSILYNHCKVVPFNPNSSDHVARVLCKLYGWEPTEFTKTGKPKTSADVIESLPESYSAFTSPVLKLGEADKLRGMVQGYLERMTGDRLHGSFNGCLTLTGRLSSSNPNLQNIPTRGEKGNQIRSLFIAPPGCSVVASDLSNIEGRVLAHYLSYCCGEHYLRDVFISGEDFHQANADMWGVTRPEAKTFLYAFLYGAGDVKLGNGDKRKGKKLRELVEEKCPALVELKQMVWEACESSDGVIHTWFGRRLVYPAFTAQGCRKEAHALKNRYPGMNLKRRMSVAKSRGQRQVFNAVLQGTAADIMKMIVNTIRPLQPTYEARLVANVHDEALYYVPHKYVDLFLDSLDEAFSQDYLSNCPIRGDAKAGGSWAEVH